MHLMLPLYVTECKGKDLIKLVSKQDFGVRVWTQ